MAQIKIIAKRSALKNGIRNQTSFRTKTGKPMVAEPIISKEEITWLVDDTDYNREIFTKYMEPSGIFTSKVINQEEVKPFDRDAEISDLKKKLKEEKEAKAKAEAEIKTLKAELEKLKNPKNAKKEG